jgi:hypothetical protein
MLALQSHLSCLEARLDALRHASGHDVTYLAKVYFIKDNLVRMPDTPEPGYEREDCYDRNGHLVVPFGALLLELVGFRLLQDIGDLFRHLLREHLRIGRCWTLLVLGRALPHLAAG